ncbi:BPSL0067 family protein [Sphingomonas sp. PB4P5]|uniref:BPSL0067 family protein n=1 Tax=Parasphingomonas puruogangriensis TaxID=3096155 RepID=UPI002FCB997B
MQVLRRGDHGPAVREIQGNLRRAGAKIDIDGVFGLKTEQAVKALQAARHLPADGLVGPRTRGALLRRPAQPKPAGADAFNPAAFGAWLARLPGMIYDAVTPDEPVAGRQQTPAASAPRAAAPPKAAVGKPVVSPGQNRKHRRIAFPNYAGRGYILQDFEQYDGYAIRLVGGVSVAPWDPKKLIKNECAQFVQFFGVPRTREWRAGPQVCHQEPGSIPVGTVVATLRDGMYHNDYSGRSHVGIYLGHDPLTKKGGGVLLLDQFNKNPIRRRLKRYDVDANEAGRATKAWTDAAGKKHDHRVHWSADGEEYFVLLTGS